MNKESPNIRIIDIAEMAGVSVGTVDRVIHNRGRVSEENEKKVRAILEKANYQPNLMARSLASKKQYHFLAITPSFKPGEYWEAISEGIDKAASETEFYNVNVTKLFFDQYDNHTFDAIVRTLFDEEDIEFAAEHDLVHTALWGKAENTLPKIAAKGIPIAFDYADRLDHPLVEETLPYVTYGFYSYHEGRDAKIEEFLKDKVSRGMKIAVVTFGEDGSLAWDGERFYVGGIEKAEVVNTVGAGDSFIAGFLYGILNGKSIDECLKKGAEVAASVVQVFEPWVE